MKRIIHIIANCRDCGWVTQDYKNGRTLARKHAKKHNHRVFGEIGISFVYDYKDKEEK